MNVMISGGLKAAISSSLLVALALTAVAPASAAPQAVAPVSAAAQAVSYTCIAEVSTGLSPAIAGQSGGAVLWSGPVSGPVPAALVSCNNKSQQAFAANTSWSDPNTFCARYAQAAYEMFLGNTLKTRLVWLTYYLQQLGHPNGYYRVGGYSVVCDGPAHLQMVPNTPTLVPNKL